MLSRIVDSATHESGPDLYPIRTNTICFICELGNLKKEGIAASAANMHPTTTKETILRRADHGTCERCAGMTQTIMIWTFYPSFKRARQNKRHIDINYVNSHATVLKLVRVRPVEISRTPARTAVIIGRDANRTLSLRLSAVSWSNDLPNCDKQASGCGLVVAVDVTH